MRVHPDRSDARYYVYGYKNTYSIKEDEISDSFTTLSEAEAEQERLAKSGNFDFVQLWEWTGNSDDRDDPNGEEGWKWHGNVTEAAYIEG